MAIKVRNRVKGKLIREYYDYNLLAVVIILMCFGLVMLYSASSYEATNTFNDDMYYLQRQALIGLLAVIIAIWVSRWDYHLLIKLSTPLYFVSLLLMAAVKFTPLGITAGGARRWLGYGSVSIQPAEIAKIAVIVCLTAEIMRLGREFYTKSGVFRILIMGFLQAFGAFYFTENLSTAIIIMLISVFIVFVAHPKTKPFIIALIFIAVLVIVGLIILRSSLQDSDDFRIRRVLVWMDPEKYSDLGGWQVLQGLYAIGSGGLFGKGLGNSTQKLDTIPEAQNDMIFSIICEELGLVGAIIVLILFSYLFYRLLFIAQNAADLEGCLIASGIFFHIAIQVILNICVVLNVIPTTGVTLPFVSYGGTSVMFLMFEIGIALSISGQIRMKVIPDKKKNRENTAAASGSAVSAKIPVDK
jgi:cell division protein FtsW